MYNEPDFRMDILEWIFESIDYYRGELKGDLDRQVRLLW